MLQVSNCNQSLLSNIPLTPNTIVTNLPGHHHRRRARVRYLSVTGSLSLLLIVMITVAQEFYEPPSISKIPAYQARLAYPRSRRCHGWSMFRPHSPECMRLLC